MKLLQLSAFLLVMLLLVVPGVLLVSLFYANKSRIEVLISGAGVGLALAVFLIFGLTYLHIYLFWPVWLSAAVVLALLWFKRRPHDFEFRWPSRRSWWLVIVLGLVLVTRFAPTFVHLMPPGGDPTFHLLLAKKIALAKTMIFDWEPFEGIKLNYPVGSHSLIVQFSVLTGLPLHTVFKLLIPMLGVLTTAQIYLLGLRVFRNAELGLYAAVAYGFLAVYGSIDYYRWGGLPNVLGMCFFLEGLILLTESKFGYKESGLLALLFTATFFAHHHVMITSGVVYGVLFVYYSLFERSGRKHIGIAYGLLGSLVLGGFYIFPYAAKAKTLQDTSVLKFEEVFFDLSFISATLGGAFFKLTLLGVGLYLFQIFRKDDERFDSLLYVVSISLCGLFVICEYVYRFISPYVYGHEYVAFTPSRFLTDLAYFLCFFAGYAIYLIRRRLGFSVSIAVLVMLLLSLFNYPVWQSLYQPTMSSDRWQTYQWINKNTPSNVIILTDDPWAAYAAWRRTTTVEIPISEPTSTASRLSPSEIVRQILSGQLSDEARQWKLISIGDSRSPALQGVTLWKHPSGLEVVEFKEQKDVSEVDTESLQAVTGETLYDVNEINGQPPTTEAPITIYANSTPQINIRGWAVDKQAQNNAGGVLINIDGKLDFQASRQPRPDVAEVYKNLRYGRAGFQASIPTATLGKGRHVISLKILTANQKGFYEPKQRFEVEVQ